TPAAEPSPPHRTFRHVYPPAGKLAPYPAITRHRYGQGEVLYIATDLFTEYFETNHAWVRQVIEALLELVDPTPPFRLENAPRTLRVNLMEREGEWLLHLVNFASNTPGTGAYPPIEYIPPIAGVRVRVRAPVEKVILQPQGETLSFVQRGEEALISIPLLGIYDVLQIVLQKK
ncbi:MAG: hypothetical protein J7M05_08835, partial [Anaerolineae bacterium]|nr:hypothetical protein [Anaerolineae bacterium]